jgi:hypothetical protein
MGPKLYPDRFCPLYYEQLLADPVGVTRRLWTFLDVDPSVIPAHEIQQIASENPKQEEHAQKAPGLVRGLPRGTRGVWRQFFTDGDVQRFHSQAELVLTQHGYPLDRFSEYPVRWTSTLEIERDSHE